MSLRVERPDKQDDSTLHWADDVTVELDDVSISSEEEAGSAFNGEQRNRSKTMVGMWESHFIGGGLQNLPDAEEILNLVEDESNEALFSKNQKTLLLIATWLEKEKILSKLLESGVSVNVTDPAGRTPLHLAACVGNTDILKLLLSHGADVNVEETVNKASPLHCAAGKSQLPCLKLLLKSGANVNAGLENKSPLHYAVQSLSTECVKELLENNATPNTPQIYSETPLHVAAALGSSEIITLLIHHGAAVNVRSGTEKLTPLHLAAEDGDAECSRLLIEAGADLFSQNHKKQTPLHLAALSQCGETLELLLSKGANPNAKDQDGRTPLHSAIVKVSRSCECVRILLNNGADVNRPDAFGYTPLHLAALNEFSNCVMLLLNNGGDVTMRTNGGVSVLNFITRKTPDVIPKYIQKFDHSVRISDHEIGDVDCELKLDFRVLVPTVGNKETELMLNFIEVGHRQVLKHPLCETFLFLKWRRIRKFFLFSLFYHSLFVTLFTYYVIGVYLKNCPSERSMLEPTACVVQLDVNIFGYFLLCFNFILWGKEMFQIFHSWKTYVKQWENWLQWCIILSVFCCVQPALDMNVRKDVFAWKHHIAAVGIFLAWLELMMIVGRFPIFGLYIQMFTTVSVNFVKFIASYFCLLVAFALSFGVLFAHYKSFKDLKWVLLKVLVMLSGELEYEDIFYDNSYVTHGYRYTSEIMFLAFVILVTVILANLMVGLAVSDIQGLQQSAGLDRLVRQAELVAHLESILFSRLLKCFPYKLLKFFHRKALLLKSQYHWALYIKPNDPREERIPRYLIKSIYRLVAERKEKPRRKRRSNKSYDLKSPSVSRLNSTSGGYDEIDKETALKEQLDDIFHEFVESTRAFREKVEAVASQIVKNAKK